MQLSPIEWRPCFGYPDYEVSEYGAVRRISSHERWGAREKTPWLRNGYVFVKMPGNKSWKVHRLVAFSFLGLPPSDRHTDVAHADGCKTNNHFSNLRWATRSENMADAVKHGTAPYGAKSGRARLTEEQVIEIHRLAQAGTFTQAEIASRFDISSSHISGILSGRFWPQIQANGISSAP